MSRPRHPVVPGDVVVVTGTSSGMGEDAALHLNALGYRVVAGVRKDADGERVRARAQRPETFHPVLLDVTNADQVAAAVETVRALGDPDRGVRGLFSNAGVASFDGDTSCEGQPVERLEHVFDVNFLGAVRFVRAFLPLVRAARGTVVVNTAMMVEVVIPFSGGYAASKSALDAWALSLRREVAPHGVRVSTIRAGAVATGLAAHRRTDEAPVSGIYPEQAAVAEAFATGLAQHADDPRCSPRRVSELVARILAEEHPRFAYAVGGGHRLLRVVGALPEPLQTRVLRRRFAAR